MHKYLNLKFCIEFWEIAKNITFIIPLFFFTLTTFTFIFKEENKHL